MHRPICLRLNGIQTHWRRKCGYHRAHGVCRAAGVRGAPDYQGQDGLAAVASDDGAALGAGAVAAGATGVGAIALLSRVARSCTRWVRSG